MRHLLTARREFGKSGDKINPTPRRRRVYTSCTIILLSLLTQILNLSVDKSNARIFKKTRCSIKSYHHTTSAIIKTIPDVPLKNSTLPVCPGPVLVTVVRSDRRSLKSFRLSAYRRAVVVYYTGNKGIIPFYYYYYYFCYYCLMSQLTLWTDDYSFYLKIQYQHGYSIQFLSLRFSVEYPVRACPRRCKHEYYG